DLTTMKQEWLSKLAKYIESMRLYRCRYYYLFIPDIFVEKYAQSQKNENNLLGSCNFIQLEKETQRYYYTYKYALESISQEWLSHVVAWASADPFHIFCSLSKEQIHKIEDSLNQTVYCDLDWSPNQFVSVLIKC